VVRLDCSGFSDSNFSDPRRPTALRKLISSAEFALEAPCAGTARTDVTRGSPKLILGQGRLASPLIGLRQWTGPLGKRLTLAP
jgi:hypothetical protein